MVSLRKVDNRTLAEEVHTKSEKKKKKVGQSRVFFFLR